MCKENDYSMVWNKKQWVSIKSVADALAQPGQNHRTATERFVWLSDKFFDGLNVSNVYNGQMKRKPDLEPYINEDDYRLKVTVFTTF